VHHLQQPIRSRRLRRRRNLPAEKRRLKWFLVRVQLQSRRRLPANSNSGFRVCSNQSGRRPPVHRREFSACKWQWRCGKGQRCTAVCHARAKRTAPVANNGSPRARSRLSFPICSLPGAAVIAVLAAASTGAISQAVDTTASTLNAVNSQRYARADWSLDDWPVRLCKSDGSNAANPC